MLRNRVKRLEKAHPKPAVIKVWVQKLDDPDCFVCETYDDPDKGKTVTRAELDRMEAEADPAENWLVVSYVKGRIA